MDEIIRDPKTADEDAKSLERIPEVTLWVGQKRHLGLPISFTHYELTNERIFRRAGLFKVHVDQTMYYRVQDINYTRTAWQWFFGVATVTVISTDKSLPDLKLENIRNAEAVKEAIHRKVEDVRAKMKIKPNEFMK